jgi:hypothetical protein
MDIRMEVEVEDTIASNATPPIPGAIILQDTYNPTPIENILHVPCVGNPSPEREAPLNDYDITT